METEVWRPVVECPRHYAVSSLGRIKRLRTGHILRVTGPQVARYALVGMSIAGRNLTRRVHTLVAEAFIGPRPSGFTCNHKNGNRFDNRAENLEWVTLRENIRHSREVLGHSNAGERHGHSKLRDADIPLIRQRLAHGEYAKLIAADYGVARETIQCIKYGKRWAHVK